MSQSAQASVQRFENWKKLKMIFWRQSRRVGWILSVLQRVLFHIFRDYDGQLLRCVCSFAAVIMTFRILELFAWMRTSPRTDSIFTSPSKKIGKIDTVVLGSMLFEFCIFVRRRRFESFRNRMHMHPQVVWEQTYNGIRDSISGYCSFLFIDAALAMPAI